MLSAISDVGVAGYVCTFDSWVGDLICQKYTTRTSDKVQNSLGYQKYTCVLLISHTFYLFVRCTHVRTSDACNPKPCVHLNFTQELMDSARQCSPRGAPKMTDTAKKQH